MNQKSTQFRRMALRVFVLGAAVLVGLFGLRAIAQSQESALTNAATSSDAVTIAETGRVELGTLTLTLDAAGSLSPAASETLTFGASAPVTEVLVQVGDRVSAGDVLARLDTTNADAQIRVAELQLAQAQASLDALLSPPTELEINLAEANVTLAQAQLYAASSGSSTRDIDIEIARLQEEIARNQLWQAQINRDVRVAQEAMRGDVSWVEQQQFDSSVNTAEDSVTLAQMDYENTLNATVSSSAITSANASLVNAQAALDKLLAGASEAEIRRAQIQVEQAQLTLQSARQSLEDYVLVAPYDGIVAEQSLTVGVNPPASGAITLIDTSRYTIDLSIAEADVVNVSEGQTVTIEVQAFPNADVTGTVARIDTTPRTSSQLVTYNAEVVLNPTDDALLRPGMSATATVVLKQLNNVLLVPNRFISTDSVTGGNVVMVESAPGVYTAVPVTIGERSTTTSQIVSGLEAGQTIVIVARETDAATSATGGMGLGGLLGGGGQPPANFQPPSGGNFQPPSGGFPGGAGG